MFTLADLLIKLFLAVILGGIIGWEREIYHKPAGFRTHILVCLGSCLFTMISIYFANYFSMPTADASRIAAGIVVGVGFLGAGAIMKEGHTVMGLTTAANIWVVSAIGMAVGCGFYAGAIITAGIVAMVVFALKKIEYLFEKNMKKHNE